MNVGSVFCSSALCDCQCLRTELITGCCCQVQEQRHDHGPHTHIGNTILHSSSDYCRGLQCLRWNSINIRCYCVHPSFCVQESNWYWDYLVLCLGTSDLCLNRMLQLLYFGSSRGSSPLQVVSVCLCTAPVTGLTVSVSVSVSVHSVSGWPDCDILLWHTRLRQRLEILRMQQDRTGLDWTPGEAVASQGEAQRSWKIVVESFPHLL